MASASSTKICRGTPFIAANTEADHVAVHEFRRAVHPAIRDFVDAMRGHNVLVRDRSNDPGCDGCVRITVGTREHTVLGIRALESSLNEIGGSEEETGGNA